MDPIEHQNLKSLTHITTSILLKKVTQLVLLSISVFSIFFSYTSWYSFFIHSFKFTLSTSPFQLLSHLIGKNITFLIFNGILVLLAKTSGFIDSSPESDDLNDQPLIKKIGDNLELSSDTKESLMLEREILVETTRPQENVVILEEEREDDYIYSLVDEDEDNEKELQSGILVEEEEEEEEINGVLSTEELNKKFDDFIRRMKEEIRIEARRQLIMV